MAGRELGPDIGEIGQRGSDHDEAGDHHRARDDEHDDLPRGDAPEGALGGIDGCGHDNRFVVRGAILHSREHPSLGWG